MRLGAALAVPALLALAAPGVPAQRAVVAPLILQRPASDDVAARGPVSQRPAPPLTAAQA